MKQSITVQILEAPPERSGSIGGYQEKLEVDDIYNRDAVLALVIATHERASQVNAPIATFSVTNVRGEWLYRGTIHSDGEKTSLSGVAINSW